MGLRRRGLGGFIEGKWGLCLLCGAENIQERVLVFADGVPVLLSVSTI